MRVSISKSIKPRGGMKAIYKSSSVVTHWARVNESGVQSPRETPPFG